MLGKTGQKWAENIDPSQKQFKRGEREVLESSEKFGKVRKSSVFNSWISGLFFKFYKSLKMLGKRGQKSPKNIDPSQNEFKRGEREVFILDLGLLLFWSILCSTQKFENAREKRAEMGKKY
jgi:hypothetical protein